MTANENMSKKSKIDLKAFEAILDTYGSDRLRWPRSSRSALDNFIDGSDAARQLLKEAEALDRVLSSSASVVASDALKGRIMASVGSDESHSAKVVPITAARAKAAQSYQVNRMRGYWPAAALAASFAFGLYLGIAGVGSQTFEGAVQVSGLVTGNGDSENSSWLDLGSASAAEDIL